MRPRFAVLALIALLAVPARADERVQTLIRQLKSQYGDMRYQAAAALGKMKPPPAEAMGALGEAVNDTEYGVRYLAVNGLFSMGEAALPTLIKAADGKNVDDRTYEDLIEKVGRLKPGDPAALDFLGKAMLSKRAGAAPAAGTGYELALRQGSVEAMRAQCLFLVGPDMEARFQAATTLGYLGKKAPPLLAKVLETETDGTGSVWRGAIEAYARLEEGPALEASNGLVPLLKTGAPFTRANAARALGALKRPSAEALEALSAAMLGDADGLAAAEAGDALAQHTPDALPRLLKALDADDAYARVRAARSLSKVDDSSEKASFEALRGVLADRGECQAVRAAAGESLMLLDKAKAREALAALKTDRRTKAGKKRASCP